MKRSEKKLVRETVELEGFDYAFRLYTDFSEIKDPKFHELREKYVNAAKALIAYCGIDE